MDPNDGEHRISNGFIFRKEKIKKIIIGRQNTAQKTED
jgi:hypothetical protein